MNIKVALVERISKKTGNPYKALELDINGYKKLVFLNAAELALLESSK